MNKKSLILLFIFSLTSITAFAGDPALPTDDPDLIVPINNWIPVAMLLAVSFAFYRIQNSKRKSEIA